MNKKALLLIALVVVAGAIFLVVRDSQKQGQLEDKINQAISSQAVETSSEVKVEVTNFGFKEQVIKIKKGTKVTWTNRDPAKHTVTSDEGNYLDSELFDNGQTYEKTFDQTGTFRYHCKPHPGMIGAVIVVE